MKNILDRIQQIADNEEITITALERKIGASKGVLSGALLRGTGINSKWLINLVENFPLYNPGWLLTGNGKMIKLEPEAIKDENATKSKKSHVAIFRPDDLPLRVGKLYRAPIYEAYPVSAGNLGLANMQSDKPNGYAYTTMPGVTFFPVVGCSFEPIIKAGNYIGVVKLDSWDRVDTEKIYFILTREERMIKRLRIDEGDQSALWCVSPNFKEFKILKSDILEISHVFFYGMMV